MMGGPYGPLGHGSFLPIIETLTSNIIQCIQKMQKDRIKSMTPKLEAAEQFKEHSQLFIKRTAWSQVSITPLLGCLIDGISQSRRHGTLVPLVYAEIPIADFHCLVI